VKNGSKAKVEVVAEGVKRKSQVIDGQGIGDNEGLARRGEVTRAKFVPAS
jgi:hypothetical protein